MAGKAACLSWYPRLRPGDMAQYTPQSAPAERFSVDPSWDTGRNSRHQPVAEKGLTAARAHHLLK